MRKRDRFRRLFDRNSKVETHEDDAKPGSSPRSRASSPSIQSGSQAQQQDPIPSIVLDHAPVASSAGSNAPSASRDTSYISPHQETHSTGFHALQAMSGPALSNIPASYESPVQSPAAQHAPSASPKQTVLPPASAVATMEHNTLQVPPVSTSSDTSANQEEERKSFFSRHPNLVHVFDGTLKLGSIFAGASSIPFLQAGVNAIIEFEAFVKAVGDHRDMCKQLIDEAVTYTSGLLDIVRLSPKNTEVPSSALFKEFLERFMAVLNGTTTTMKATMVLMKNSGIKARAEELWNQGKITQDIQTSTEGLRNARLQFVTLNSALTGFTVDDILRDVNKLLLAQSKWNISRLPHIAAAYNEDRTIRACHHGTRTDIINEILTWLSSGTVASTAPPALTSPVDSTTAPPPRVIWMRATAGSGKSTIAKSVAQLLEHERRLAATFFFSRDITARAGMNDVFATLANQFAVHNDAFATALASVMDQSNYILPTDPEDQLDELLIKPLTTTASSLPSDQSFIFIVDALDECGADQGEKLLSHLLAKVGSFPPQVRFFLTSRPEAPLIDKFSEHMSRIRVVDLDDAANVETAQTDITTYLSVDLQNMRGWSPPSNKIHALARLCNGLFQFAATATVLIVEAAKRGMGPDMLEDILAIQGGVGVLNQLYDTVLEQAYPSSNQIIAHLKDRIFSRHRDVIGVVVYARKPISIATLAGLIERTEEDVNIALQPLSSVILLPNPNDFTTPIRIRHLSFIDYITNPAAKFLKENPELLLEGSMDEKMTLRTLSIMKKELHFNMSNTESSFLPKSALLEPDVQTVISPTLAYSCQFWGYHLEDTSSQMTGSKASLVVALMEKQLFFWFESLGILGVEALMTGTKSLLSLSRWLEAAASENGLPRPNLLLLVNDAIRFLRYFGPVILQSPSHTYLSTIPFAPTSSAVAQHYISRFQGLISLEIGQLLRWPTDPIILKGHSSSVLSVAFSPDGKRVVSGSWDKTIRIWDAETGETMTGPFEGHSASVLSVAFSPDGKRVVSGSSDNTIRIWDAETGETVARPFEGHSWAVNSVAFSPDGKRVISGSDDKTIRMWDAETGETVAGPFKGHSASVLSVAFSPDGKRVVSGSSENTIRIWDAETRETMAGPFEGHSDSVLSVAFSPDGKRVVSGSWDKTVRIWDAETGETMTGPFEGHSDPVLSVAFSPDGKRVVSGSSDKTIRVWDAETRETVAGPFEGHSDSVLSVAFSPDGKRVVSGSSDNTIRMWDAETGETVAGPFEGHNDSVWSVAFSPDGKRVVSGSEDYTIQTLNIKTKLTPSLFTNQSPINADGWMHGANDRLLFWVPPLHQKSFYRPSTHKVIGPYETRVNCDGVAWGEEWTRCYVP